MIKERNIVLQVILSLVTCGIYAIIWMIQLTDDVVEASKGEAYNTSGVMAVVLTLVTCGIYGIYWAYIMGKSVGVIKRLRTGVESDDSIIYIILSLFGFSIVVNALIQVELNNVANDGSNKYINA